jgi:hypothetical protein
VVTVGLAENARGSAASRASTSCITAPRTLATIGMVRQSASGSSAYLPDGPGNPVAALGSIAPSVKTLSSTSATTPVRA